MSAISSTAQPVVSTGDGSAVPVPSAEVDASCRAPVLLLFLSAAVWLFIGSVFGIIATLKFHSPTFLADCASLTYGRVHPAHLNALIYGFGIQAGLGLLLWLTAHLGRVRLALSPVIMIGAILWNLGVALGLWGIFCGDSTGFEWLEMPRYASVILFFAYLLMGLGGMVTFHLRHERPLYISQLFLLAALFWFPWIYSTANLLLVAKPVRGALQVAINYWYAHNLVTIWFGFVGLAAIFYFIPKISKRPFHSHYLGLLIFWILAVFGSWGGIPTATPLPEWMAALSTVAMVLTVVPVIAVVMSIHGTLAGNYSAPDPDSTFKFILFGAAAFILARLCAIAAALGKVSEVLNFTWFMPAQMQLALYGFFAMTIFGAVYYIVPRLLSVSFSPKQKNLHFWLAAPGILLYAVPLAIGGVKQGLALNDKNVPFLDVMTSTLPFLRASTMGDLLMALANLVFLLNLIGLLYRVGRPAVSAVWTANTKSAGVAS